MAINGAKKSTPAADGEISFLFYFRTEMVVPTRWGEKIANDFRFVDKISE